MLQSCCFQSKCKSREKALRKLTFFVAIDLFISETATYADVILPASSYLEDEGTMTNVEGRVTLREASRPCPGEAKHDWQIICKIASALGKAVTFLTRQQRIFLMN